MKDSAETKPRGRPALPEEEKAVTGSVRLTPVRWAKLRALGMAWLGKAIDRAKAPGVSILHPMAPIADLLSKDRLTADERRVVDAHIATVQAEANQIGALARKMARAAKAKETARK